MPSTDPSMDANEWDLGDVLSERAQPTDEVVVSLNEVAAYAKSKLTDALAKATETADVKKLEKQLAEVEKDLESSRYTIHLTGIPTRMSENLVSKALHQFPLKLDFMGRDEPENAMNRLKAQNNLLWNAQIVNVVNPKGVSKRSWSVEETEKFAEQLPVSAQNAIDEKIKDLGERVNRFIVASQSSDF